MRECYCLLWCSFSCSLLTWHCDGILSWRRPGDWACWSGLHDTNYCSEELLVRLFRILKSSLPLLTLIFPSFKFSPTLFTLSSPLFPPSPIVSPFAQAWLDLKLHVSTVCYYHPLELRSNLLVLEPPVLTSVSVLCMHLCIHPLFPRLVLVSPLKLVHIKTTSSEPQSWRRLDWLSTLYTLILLHGILLYKLCK